MNHKPDWRSGPSDVSDARLRRLFGSLDTGPAFEEQVLARVRAQADSTVQRSKDAVAREEQFYQETVGALRRSRQAAFRTLLLDALAVSAVLMALITALTRSQAAPFGWIQSYVSVVSELSVLLSGTLLGVVIALVPMVLFRIRDANDNGSRAYTPPNVSHSPRLPDFRPRSSPLMRCSALPWVNDSGTMTPRVRF